MKKFFGIVKSKYCFEWADISALLTILNVTLIVCGWYYAPIIGLVNCGLAIGLNIRNTAHINNYLIQIALIVLNIYFLTL